MRRPKAEVGAVVVDVEIPHLPGDHHLVGLLEILPGHEIVADLRRKRVEGDLFKMVGKLYVAGNGQHGFEREHHLHRGTQFRTLGGVVAVQGFIASVKTLRLADVFPDIGESPFGGNLVLFFRMLLVINQGFLDPLCQVHTVEAPGSRKMVPAQECLRKIEGLLMKQIRQFEEEGFTGNVVQPVNHHQVIAGAEFPPEGPVPQGCFGKMLQLVPEVGGQEVDHPCGLPWRNNTVSGF